MKDKDIIKLFDQIEPDILAKTDLAQEGDMQGLDSAGNAALKRARTTPLLIKKRRRFFPWKNLVAAAATLVIITTIVLNLNSPQPVHGVASPDYPQGVGFYDNQGRWGNAEEINADFLANLSKFSFASAALVLSELDREVNGVFSPLSLFMALAMVTEGARGETQDELLQALNMPNMAMVRSETGKLFRTLYTDNEIGKLNLANSLWLNKDVDFNSSFLHQVAKDYYAHSFSVDFNDSDTAKQISQWVSENTGGKLGNDPKAFQPVPDQIINIINTVYFYDEWSTRFNPDATTTEVFHRSDGSTVSAQFMNSTRRNGYAQGPDYLATSLRFKNDQSMFLILPDEGVSPYDILADPESLSQALVSLASDSASAEIILSLPKFDFKSQLGLEDTLAKMGVEQAFIPQADFSNIARTEPLFISNVRQNLSISIDEKGCEAAAFTQILLAGSGPPAETIEMKLDRPFIFAIGIGDLPLFIGVVNDPTAK